MPTKQPINTYKPVNSTATNQPNVKSHRDNVKQCDTVSESKVNQRISNNNEVVCTLK